MKKIILLVPFLCSLYTAIAQCDNPNIWLNTWNSVSNVRELKTYNLSTSTTSSPVCGTFRPSTNTTQFPTNDYYDIAFAPNGSLFALAYFGNIVGSNPINYYSPSLVTVPTSGCGISFFARTGSVDFYNYAPNSLTFLPDGTALIGYGFDFRNNNTNYTTTKIQRIRITGTNYTLEDWQTFTVPGGQSIVAGGDFILLGDKLYAAIVTNTNTNILYEIRVDASYNPIATTGTYTFPTSGNGILQGMAAVNGVLYGGFSDGSIGKLTFTGTTITPTVVATMPANDNVFGMTALNESTQSSNPSITAPGTTICPATSTGLVLTSSATIGNQWFKDGVLIAGATSQTYTVPATAAAVGTYTVEVSYGAGCVITTGPYRVTENCTVLKVTGSLWQDPNQNAIFDAAENGTNLATTSSNGLWVNLVNSAGVVVASVPVGPNGTYGFEITNTGNYTVRVSNTGIAIGRDISTLPSNDPLFALPGDYVHSGTNVGGVPNTANKSGSIPIVVSESVSGINFGLFSANALPVVFASVAASWLDNGLEVSWVTLSEKNNQKFEIEVSKDGNNFIKVAEVASKAVEGNSNANIRYSITFGTSALMLGGVSLFFAAFFGSFVSKKRAKTMFIAIIMGIVLFAVGCTKAEQAIESNASLFVRIAQVDADGTKSYSKVVKVIRN